MTTKREITIRKLNALAESTTHAPEAYAARGKAEELKIRSITVQIAPATERDPGQVTFGFYTVDGNVLTMTDGEGAVVRHQNGEPYKHILEPGQDPRPIAARFTKEIRKAATGERIAGFWGRINYPKIGIV